MAFKMVMEACRRIIYHGKRNFTEIFRSDSKGLTQKVCFHYAGNNKTNFTRSPNVCKVVELPVINTSKHERPFTSFKSLKSLKSSLLFAQSDVIRPVDSWQPPMNQVKCMRSIVVNKRRRRGTKLRKTKEYEMSKYLKKKHSANPDPIVVQVRQYSKCSNPECLYDINLNHLNNQPIYPNDIMSEIRDKHRSRKRRTNRVN